MVELIQHIEAKGEIILICSNCKKENKDGVKFCAFCGSRMQAETPQAEEIAVPEPQMFPQTVYQPTPQNKICPACGKENDSSMNFCIACGTKLSGEAPMNTAPPVMETPKPVWEEISDAGEEPMVDIAKTEVLSERINEGVNRCTACLKDNLPGARFCLYCGNALSGGAPQNFDVAPKVPVPSPKAKKKSGKVWVVILIILLVLGLIAGGLYYAYEYLDLFSFGGDDDDSEKQKATKVEVVEGESTAPYIEETETVTTTETRAETLFENVSVDDNLLSEEEAAALDTVISDKEKASSLDIFVIFTKNYASDDTRAKDYVNLKGENSICLVLETEKKNVLIEAGKEAQDKLSDKTTEIITAHAKELLLSGKYADACKEAFKMIYNDENLTVYEMIEGSEQVVYVTKDDNATTGKLQVVDWTDGAEVVYTIDKVYLGKDGITASPSESKCATPQGAFPLGFAFSDDTLNTELETVKIKENMVWVDDASSKYYNTLQSSTKSDKDWSSAEDTYNIFKGGYNNACILIEHNGDGKTAGVSGKGSCIYIAGKEKDLSVSYGDVNISASQMTTLLSILSKECNPYIVVR